MMSTNAFLRPFSPWLGHRMFQVLAGTLISVAVATQASAMLPTPEPELDNPSHTHTAAVTQSATATQSSQQNVRTALSAFLVAVDAEGQEILVPVDASTRLQSGHVVEYQAHFTNQSPDRIRSMTTTLSIPEQVELIEGISPEGAFASVDAVSFAPMPLRGTINGQLQDIPLQYHKALRWTLHDLAVNDTTMVKYRARVK